jgi:hypothetical protein
MERGLRQWKGRPGKSGPAFGFNGPRRDQVWQDLPLIVAREALALTDWPLPA